MKLHLSPANWYLIHKHNQWLIYKSAKGRDELVRTSDSWEEAMMFITSYSSHQHQFYRKYGPFYKAQMPTHGRRRALP